MKTLITLITKGKCVGDADSMEQPILIVDSPFVSNIFANNIKTFIKKQYDITIVDSDFPTTNVHYYKTDKPNTFIRIVQLPSIELSDCIEI